MTISATSSRRTRRLDAPAAPALAGLVRVEARRCLRNPLLLGGFALSAWFMWVPWFDREEAPQGWATENYDLFGFAAVPLYLAAFLLANGTALRERSSTTAQLFDTVPFSRWGRTLAVVVTGLVPLAFGTVLSLGEWALVRRAGGITVGIPGHASVVQPTVLEAMHVPALTLVVFCAGAAVARTLRSRAVGAVLGTFGVLTFILSGWLLLWFPAGLVAPAGQSLRHTALGPTLDATEAAGWQLLDPPSPGTPSWSGIERDLLLSGGHTVYLVGAAILLGTYAVWRSGSDRRTRWGLLVGSVVGSVGIGLQVLSYGGTFPWWERI